MKLFFSSIRSTYFNRWSLVWLSFVLLSFFSNFVSAELPLSPDGGKYWTAPITKNSWIWTRAPYPNVGMDTSNVVGSACGYVDGHYPYSICPTEVESVANTDGSTSIFVRFANRWKPWRPWNYGSYEKFNSHPEKVCPISHPTPKDFDGDGEIDICFNLSCPDNGKSANVANSSSSSASPSSWDWVGNPVRCSTGEKVEVENVYRGSGADALSFSTYYSSPKYDEETQSLGNYFDSHSGKQRSDRNNKRLELIYHNNGFKAFRANMTNGKGRVFFGAETATSFPSIDNLSGSLNLSSSNYVQTKPDGSVYTFNENGKLVSFVAASGLTRNYTYTQTGKLDTVTNHYGKQLQYFYNTEDRLQKIVAPENTEYLFEYDTIGNMTKIVFPDDTPLDANDNSVIEYLYENASFPNHLTGKINENGIRLATWLYDAEGRAISSEHYVSIEKVQLDYSVES